MKEASKTKILLSMIEMKSLVETRLRKDIEIFGKESVPADMTREVLANCLESIEHLKEMECE